MDQPSRAETSARAAEDEVPLHVRLNLTPTRLVLAAVALWAATVVPFLVYYGLVRPLFGMTQGAEPDAATMEVLTATHSIVPKLNLFDPRGALIAALLLYFPIAQRGSPRERQERRGETFTGILNLHILVVAVALPLILFSTEKFSPVVLGIYLLGRLAITASCCLIGFHLCEGRLFVPAVGILLSTATGYAFPQSFGDYGSWFVYSFVQWLMPGLVLFAWQLGTLVHFGSGFDAFPTGLAPALHRAARVFLPVSVCLWILGPMLWVVAAPFVPSFHTSQLMVVARDLWGEDIWIIAYIVPLLFLAWPPAEFSRRSRRLILYLFIGRFLLSIPVSYFGLISLQIADGAASMGSSFPPQGTLETLNLFSVCMASTVWSIYIPLCLFRWWSRARFRRPLVITIVVAAVVVPALLVVPTPVDEGFAWELILGQALAFVIVNATLFRPSPCKQSQPDPS